MYYNIYGDREGNFLNKSPNRSIGAVIKPTAVSNGGFAGAMGCDLEGTNILVRSNCFANPSLSPWVSTSSSLTRSCSSSSLICLERSAMRDFRVGSNSLSDSCRFWNFLSFSFIYSGKSLI